MTQDYRQSASVAPDRLPLFITGSSSFGNTTLLNLRLTTISNYCKFKSVLTSFIVIATLFSSTKMGLKDIVKYHIMVNAIQKSCLKKNDPVKEFNWSVLVLDNIGMKIMSSCCSMHEVCYNGITLVEDLHKVREPVDLDAVYFLAPIQSSIDALLNDFPLTGNTKYKSAHIYFTHACPENIFKYLTESLPKKKIVSLQEIDISFIPFESQVYSLDSRITFQACFNSALESTRIHHLETLASQIASVCYALNEYPSVRYIKGNNHKNTKELAQLVQKKLDELKKHYPNMGVGFEKNCSQLIIIERSFDWVSLILHELTFQSMAYDNFSIVNNVFKYTEGDAEKEIIFSDDDEVFAELRHQHIYNAADAVRLKLKNCVDSGLVSTVDAAQSTSLGGLSYVIKKIPQQQKVVDQLSKYMSALKKCVNFYGDHLEDICIFEQDLAMGKEAIVEDKITYDVKKKLISFLTDDNVSIQNKMRLIILYILYMNGVSEDIFNELVQNAQLSPADIQTILNLNKLGVTVYADENNKKPKQTKPRKDRVDENTFQVSRWTPKIKDIIENCIENQLDVNECPYISAAEQPHGKYKASRYNDATWYKGEDQKKQGSKIILFVIGGVTHSEMRSVYEVSKNHKNLDIVIGSSHITTPEDFLKDLSDLGDH